MRRNSTKSVPLEVADYWQSGLLIQFRDWSQNGPLGTIRHQETYKEIAVIAVTKMNRERNSPKVPMKTD